MHRRRFGRIGWQVSEIGFGAWQIGADWGQVSDDAAVRAIHAALDSGVNFIDTADVYGDGRSERLIARALSERTGGERVYVATKAGRRLQPHVAEGYARENLTAFVDRSLRNLKTERLDLVQLHCPPTDVYYRREAFDALDELQRAGKIAHYGVSVEKVEEAIKAIDWPGVASVQIVFNMFRQRPAELFFDLARRADVAVIARVPLASGLLSGKMSRETRFAVADHRNFNRRGEAFDVGETFAGVPFETGLDAVEELRRLLPEAMPMVQAALRWILAHDAVSVVIPGARDAEQARSNAVASEAPPLSPEAMAAIRDVYDRRIRPHVHWRW